MSITKELIDLLAETDLQQHEDGSFTYTVNSDIGIVLMMLHPDEEGKLLSIGSGYYIKMPLDKKDALLEVANYLNNLVDATRISIIVEENLILSELTLEINKKFDKDDYFYCVSTTVQAIELFIPAFIMLVHTDMEVGEVLERLEIPYMHQSDELISEEDEKLNK